MLLEYCASYTGRNFIWSPTEDMSGYMHSSMSSLQIGKYAEHFFDGVAPGLAGLSIDTSKYDTQPLYIIGLRVYPIWLDSDLGEMTSFKCQFIAQDMTNKSSLQTLTCGSDVYDNNLVNYFDYDYAMDRFEPLFDFKQGKIYNLYLTITGDDVVENLENVRVMLYLNGSCDECKDEPEKNKCAPCTIL